MKKTNKQHKALIMVVDDNPEFLAGLQLTLEMEGFEVLPTANGQQALDELRACLEQENKTMDALPDLILADIMMPIMDGYAFYERVRDNPYTNHIPIIFLTAKDTDDDIRYGKELGSEDYLTKLASTEDLLASVRGKLNRIEQRRQLAAQYTGDNHSGNEEGTPYQGNIVVLLVIFAFLIVAFAFGLASIMGLL